MTYHRFDDKFDLPNRFNTAICDDCGALIPVGDQETHDAREAKINALLEPQPEQYAVALVDTLQPEIEQNRANPRPTRARAKKEEADVPGNGA